MGSEEDQKDDKNIVIRDLLEKVPVSSAKGQGSPKGYAQQVTSPSVENLIDDQSRLSKKTYYDFQGNDFIISELLKLQEFQSRSPNKIINDNEMLYQSCLGVL